MAHFGKFANLSPKGWVESSWTQTIQIGQHAHIGLFGGDDDGNDFVVRSANPTVCVVHEEPLPVRYPHWRHFLITALTAGEARINATVASTGFVYLYMTVKVVGSIGARMVFFPGERLEGKTTVGTIYVIGGSGETMKAAGGPPVGYPDRGGHTADPTPTGHYTLGPRIHVVAPSWPSSVIAWGSALRLTADGEVEYEKSPGRWVLATGPKGAVTAAKMAFHQRSGLKPKLADVIADTRAMFIDSAGNLYKTEWEKNDFGRWGWNLRRNGESTAYFIHTTPNDEMATAQGKAVALANSHGCLHLVPAERDRLMKAGFLKEGTPFEVRPYTETGPP